MSTNNNTIANPNTISSNFWCHVCHKRIKPQPASEALSCPDCHGDFIEEIEAQSEVDNSHPSNFTVITQNQPANPVPNPPPVVQPLNFNFGNAQQGDPGSIIQRFLQQFVNPAQQGQYNFNFSLNNNNNNNNNAQPNNNDIFSIFDQLLPGGMAGGAPIVFQPGTFFPLMGGGGGNFGDYFTGDINALIAHLMEHDPNRHGTPPASKIAIAGLPKLLIAQSHIDEGKQQGKNGDCVICSDSFEIGNEVKEMPCKHYFHTKCIDKWLGSEHNSCPVCRYELPTDDVDYENYKVRRAAQNNNNNPPRNNNTNNNNNASNNNNNNNNNNNSNNNSNSTSNTTSS